MPREARVAVGSRVGGRTGTENHGLPAPRAEMPERSLGDQLVAPRPRHYRIEPQTAACGDQLSLSGRRRGDYRVRPKDGE